MIRSFFSFYRVWRKYRNRFSSLKCAWVLVWMHRKIDKDINKMGPEEYVRRLTKEIE